MTNLSEENLLGIRIFNYQQNNGAFNNDFESTKEKISELKGNWITDNNHINMSTIDKVSNVLYDIKFFKYSH